MSKFKNILFRADSSLTIGTGHIMRDLVLAKEFQDATISFASQNLDGNINHKVLEAGYALELLDSNDVNEMIQLVTKLKIDFVVIDNYSIDYVFEKALKEKTGVSILAFDDTYEKHYCDILLNHNISADELRYKDLVPVTCKLRCGSKYTLLREEFLEKLPQKKPSKNFNVLIAMGGVDSKVLTVKILEVLSSFKNITIDIITTKANKNLENIQKFVLDKKNTVLHINSTEVAKLMHKSDFAILTPSVTVNEAYFMKLPFIAIQTEDNQQDMYEYLLKNNFSVLKKFDASQLHQKIKLILDKLSSQLINFTELTLDEKKMVLKWRNSESVKKWMYNRTEISLENHLKYINSLHSKNDRVYFLLKNAYEALGVVDLTEIQNNRSAALGIYANPDLKGYGMLLMSKIIKYAFDELHIKTLYANVYIDNTKAIHLYEKFNFRTLGTTEDENGTLQNMELINENR